MRKKNEKTKCTLENGRNFSKYIQRLVSISYFLCSKRGKLHSLAYCLNVSRFFYGDKDKQKLLDRLTYSSMKFVQ